MWSKEKIEAYIREKLEPERFNHVLGVVDSAAKLAEAYDGNIEKAVIGAMIHDCAKNMTDEEIMNIVESNGYEADWVSKRSPQLLHGLAGGLIGKNLMGINDGEIFEAVRYHTTGRRNMSLLDKIIYLADYIEPGRNFPGVEELRKLAFEDIDKAVLAALNNTIAHVIKKGQLLHTDTVDARNFFICRD